MSADLNNKVVEAKNALMIALGDNMQKYLNNMKLWFRYKWTKEEFDIESRKLLTAKNMHLHNQFLLAILNKIDTYNIPQQETLAPDLSSINNSTSSSSNKNNRKRKRSSHFSSERATFEPYDLYDYLSEENVDTIRAPNSTDEGLPPTTTQKYCVQELFLPDLGFMMGRFLIGAWEVGLIHVDDSVGEYVCLAVQILLKNILSAIIMKRKYARTTGEGNFYYDIGASIKNPFTRNTVTRQKIDDAPIENEKEIASVNIARKFNEDSVFLSACEELYPQKKHVICVRDVYKALKDRNIIGSHYVYSLNMERITQMLN